jgi:hypothetical protein
MRENRPGVFDLPIGVSIKCVEQDEYGCYGCAFNIDRAMFSRRCNAPEGLICGHHRNDKKDIIFKLVKYQEMPVDIKTVHEIPWEVEE